MVRLGPPGRGRAAGDRLKTLDEVAAGGEPQTVGDLLHGQPGGLQQHLGPLDLGELDVVGQGVAGLPLEAPGDIIVIVPQLRGQVRRLDLLFQVQVDVVHAFLHHRAVARVGAAAMDSMDEIVVHRGGQVQQFLLAAGIFGPLDVGVPQRIGFFRADAAFNGGAADKTGEHRDAGFYLAQRVGTGYRHPAAEQAGIAESLGIVEVPVAHHVQQRPLGRIDLIPVPLGRLGRLGGAKQFGGHDDVAVMQRLPGQAVVHVDICFIWINCQHY